MNKIERILRKYRLNIEDLIPYENIEDEIKILEEDLAQIHSILLRNKDDKSICNYGEKAKITLSDKVEYLKDKLVKFVKSETEDSELWRKICALKQSATA